MKKYDIHFKRYVQTFVKETLTPKGPKAIFKPFLKFEQAIVKAIFLKNS
jgi:hypothetical protein